MDMRDIDLLNIGVFSHLLRLLILCEILEDSKNQIKNFTLDR